MGLDIVAYSKLKKVEVELDEDGHPVDEDAWDSYNRVYATGGRNQHDDLVDRGFYDCEGEEYSFRAGGYGGYNAWRDTLAKLAGYPLTPYETRYSGSEASHAAACWDGETQGPFAEMIDFSDCEGCIGPKTSAKLFKDFVEFEDRAKTFVTDDEGWFFKKYLEWKRAYEVASDGGMVRFT